MVLRLAITPAMSERSCKSCSACCVYLRIDSKPGLSTRFDTNEDIAKEAGVRCKYLGPSGCQIYDARPVVCRRFKCDWLKARKGFDASPQEAGYFSFKNNKFFII